MKKIKIALYAPADTCNRDLLLNILEECSRRNVMVQLPEELSEFALSSPMRANVEIVNFPDETARFLLSVGGDGTFLRSARWSLQSSQIPIAGINAGTLGFLTSWERNELPKLLEMAHGSFNTRPRTLLQVNSPLMKDEWNYALNEIALLRSQTAQMITVEAHLDGSPLTVYTGDGLLACTPTGSTGYNLSAGGPILEPETDAMILTPVAPHTLTQRPLVLRGGSQLDFCVSARTGSFLLSIDGSAIELPAGAQLSVKKADKKLQIIPNPSEDFGKRLRAKLMWGAGNPLPIMLCATPDL